MRYVLHNDYFNSYEKKETLHWKKFVKCEKKKKYRKTYLNKYNIILFQLFPQTIKHDFKSIESVKLESSVADFDKYFLGKRMLKILGILLYLVQMKMLKCDTLLECERKFFLIGSSIY